MPGFEQTENEIKYRLKDPGLFLDDSFRRKEITDGVSIVMGKLKSDPGSMVAQALRFEKPKFDLEKARAWQRAHKSNFSLKSGELKGVEVFKVGKWNGDNYTLDDLNTMAAAFAETSNTYHPYVKLGHNEDQKLPREDGYPSCGWVTNLYVKGQSLLADLSDIPDKVYQLILKKAYRKVSSEIFWNLELGEKKYNRFLAGIALLGADMPGVTSISDILALYSLNFETAKTYNENYESKKTYVMEEVMDEKEVTELKEKLEAEKLAAVDAEVKKYTALEAEFKTFKEAQETKDKEIEELKKFKADADAAALKAQEEAKKASQDKFIAELEAERLLTPAMKSYAVEFLSEKKEYTINEKPVTKEQALKDFLKLAHEASKVNFDNNSLDGNKGKNDDEAKIDAYMKENKCDYKAAYKAIMKGKK